MTVNKTKQSAAGKKPGRPGAKSKPGAKNTKGNNSYSNTSKG